MEIRNFKTDAKGLARIIEFLDSEENLWRTQPNCATYRLAHTESLRAPESVLNHTGHYSISIEQLHEEDDPSEYQGKLLDLLKEVAK